MEHESRGLTEHRGVMRGASCRIHNVLTGQAVQLLSERGHNDVVLHDVRHLVLMVLLIKCDQDIGAGVPNLNERHVTPAVYK